MALPRRMLLLAMAVLMALLLMTLMQVLAAPTTEDSVGGVRVAEARPVIGGPPPGTIHRDERSATNYGATVRTEPNTGGPQR